MDSRNWRNFTVFAFIAVSNLLPSLGWRTCLLLVAGWGWLGYDLAWEIEQLPKLNQDTLPFPVAYWYEPECFARTRSRRANSMAGC